MKSVTTVLLIIAATLILGGCVVLNLARFGAAPDAQQQKAYSGSANYNAGEQTFHNQVTTPVLKEGISTWSVMWGNLTSSADNLAPKGAIPVNKVDFKSLPREENMIVRLGH